MNKEIKEVVEEFESYPTPPDLTYMSDWLRTTLTTKKAEWEEAERERCRILICPCGCDMFMDEEGYEEAHSDIELKDTNLN